jgi:hypothetical protein
MSLILSGTDGLSDVDGSAATPAIRGTDANTGIFFPAADTIAFAEGGAEVMRIDSDGDVGIGTSSPAYKLEVRSSMAVLDGSANIGFYANGTSFTQIWQTLQSTNDLLIKTTAAKYIAFLPNNAEAMRIDSSGNLLVGQTSGNAGARVSIDAGSTDGSPCIDFRKGSATTTTSQVYARFFCDGGAVATGSITANGVAAATFTAYSDRRLKENIIDLPSQLANIMALRPVEFDYIESMGGGHQFGFIAQEVQEVYPDVVGEGADGMLTLADMNKNDARLIKAIQEMKTIIDTQASTITALTARITALETPAPTEPTETQA